MKFRVVNLNYSFIILQTLNVTENVCEYIFMGSLPSMHAELRRTATCTINGGMSPQTLLHIQGPTARQSAGFMRSTPGCGSIVLIKYLPEWILSGNYHPSPLELRDLNNGEHHDELLSHAMQAVKRCSEGSRQDVKADWLIFITNKKQYRTR